MPVLFFTQYNIIKIRGQIKESCLLLWGKKGLYPLILSLYKDIVIRSLPLKYRIKTTAVGTTNPAIFY